MVRPRKYNEILVKRQLLLPESWNKKLTGLSNELSSDKCRVSPSDIIRHALLTWEPKFCKNPFTDT